MNHDPEHIQKLFDAASLLNREERIDYLREACGDDITLFKEIQSLLKHLASTETELDEPASIPGEYHPGDTIDRYTILEPLGEGGMGAVYLARQDKPLRRLVAIKVLKPGMDTKNVIARFQAERQALAMMDHPGIARVFEAGSTDAGRPWFTMEYVKGESVCAYCDRHRLDLRSRLELFAKICDAVQHAHQKGIIHRDLKPSNILVSVDNRDEPQPKVIDFGIAKAASQPLTDLTLHTSVGQVIGTLQYMAPEQLDMSGLDVDTRSDVYALGVSLYELLTGHTPFDTTTLLRIGMDEIKRTIRETDPPKPSTKLSTLDKDETARIAELRRSQPNDLSGILRRELEWIPLKALMKDRTDRYSSAESLAGDIRRYLDGEALEAGPPTRSYRIRKFIRRHRTALIVACSFLLLLTLGIVTNLVIWQQASTASRVAETQTALAAESTKNAQEAKRQAEDASKSLNQEMYFSGILKAQQVLDNDSLAWNAGEHIARAAKGKQAGLPTPELDLLWREALTSYIQDGTIGIPGHRYNDHPIAHALSPDGSLLITGDGWIYDTDARAQTGRLALTLPEADYTSKIEFSGDGELVHLVQSTHGERFQRSHFFDLTESTDPIRILKAAHVHFHPATRAILWWGGLEETQWGGLVDLDQGTDVTLSASQTDRLDPRIQTADDIAWSNDGTKFAVLSYGQGPLDDRIHLYSVAGLFDSDDKATLPNVTIEPDSMHGSGFNDIGFAGKNELLYASSSHSLITFDSNTGEPAHTLAWPDGSPDVPVPTTIDTGPTHVIWSNNEAEATAVLDVESMSMLKPPRGSTFQHARTDNLWKSNDIIMSPGGTFLAALSEDGVTHTYDLHQYIDHTTVQPIQSRFNGHNLQFSDQDMIVAQGLNDRIWLTRHAELLPWLYLEYCDEKEQFNNEDADPCLNLWASTSAISPDGRYLVALGDNPEGDAPLCHVWDILTRERVLDTPLAPRSDYAYLPSADLVCVNADFTRLLAVVNNEYTWELLGYWDLLTGEDLIWDEHGDYSEQWIEDIDSPERFHIDQHAFRVTTHEYDNDGLVTWDMQTGAKVAEYPFGNHDEWELLFLGQNVAGHPCTFHGNDDEIIFSSWQQPDSSPQIATSQLPEGYPRPLTVSDDGKLAACLVEHWPPDDEDKWLELLTFNATYPSGPTTTRLEMPADFHEATSLRISPDNTTVFVDGACHKISTGELLYVMEDIDSASQIHPLPHADRFLTVNDDLVLRLSDFKTGRAILNRQLANNNLYYGGASEAVESIVFVPNSESFITSSYTYVQLWDTRPYGVQHKELREERRRREELQPTVNEFFTRLGPDDQDMHSKMHLLLQRHSPADANTIRTMIYKRINEARSPEPSTTD